MNRPNRQVHAISRSWEIVRYDRAGKWFAEWVDPNTPPPGWVGPSHLGISVNRAGRAPLTVSQAATAAIGLEAQVVIGLPGGATFERELIRRTTATNKEETL